MRAEGNGLGVPLVPGGASASSSPSTALSVSRLFGRWLRLVTIAPLLLPIRLYQWMISPLLPPACRFYPTCSHYAAEALLRHGLVKGSFLGGRRICRCHPWHEGGDDPVP